MFITLMFLLKKIQIYNVRLKIKKKSSDPGKNATQQQAVGGAVWRMRNQWGGDCDGDSGPTEVTL